MGWPLRTCFFLQCSSIRQIVSLHEQVLQKRLAFAKFSKQLMQGTWRHLRKPTAVASRRRHATSMEAALVNSSIVQREVMLGAFVRPIATSRCGVLLSDCRCTLPTTSTPVTGNSCTAAHMFLPAVGQHQTHRVPARISISEAPCLRKV